MERKTRPPTRNRQGKEEWKTDSEASEKCKPKQKEVNSWDCSTPTGNGKTSKKQSNDWDSSSECQETMVEPFDGCNDLKDDDNWDSESEKNFPVAEKEKKELFSLNSGSVGLSIIGELSDLEKSIGSSETDKGVEELLVVDLEEFPKTETSQEEKDEPCDFDTESEKVRTNQSGTPEDTTVWMIPKSERTQSADSTSRLLSGSGLEKTEKLQFSKKSKSLSNVQRTKNKRRSSRTTRSNCLDFDKNFLSHEEGLQVKVPKLKEDKSDGGGFVRNKVFFTEYECRTMTMEQDEPEKASGTSRSNLSRGEDGMSESEREGSLCQSLPENRNNVSSARGHNRPGPSVDMNVLSMPDIYGRKSAKHRQKDNHRGAAKDGQGGGTNCYNQATEMSHQTESWFLLENSGQYQEITRNEVSILMNGRSADAVLLERKQFVIPQLKLTDRGSLKESLSCIFTKDSLQHLLTEEDTGGEGCSKKLDLERKLENTLLYIQSGINQTASIKIIPVNTDMINIWRTARDNESHISSEADMLISTEESIGAMARSSNFVRRTPAQEPVAEQDEPQVPETAGKPSTTSYYSFSNALDYSKLLFETREIVDNLANSFKFLQNRLDGETNKSLALQNEVNKLRTLLRNFGNKLGEKNSREVVFEQPINSSQTIFTHKSLDKTEGKSDDVIEEENEEEVQKVPNALNKTEIQQVQKGSPQKSPKQAHLEKGMSSSLSGNDLITVNIYTVDDTDPEIVPATVHESNSLIQSNLALVEDRMKRLQEENIAVMQQNGELKKKLKEISQELEKYLSETSEHELHADEPRDVEPLRDQVCNLKLELENMQKLAGTEQESLLKEIFLIREEFTKSLISLNGWCSAAANVQENIETAKKSLREGGIALNGEEKPETPPNPKTFSDLINAYIQQTTQNLFMIKNENLEYEKTLKESGEQSKQSRDTSTLDQVISGYAELIEQCKKGQITGETEGKVMEDYFAIIMEKATLMEEIKILKTENEMLTENQVQHYEKLKETMIALKDQKNEIAALESSQRLSEEEKEKMADVLKVNNKELENLKKEISMGNKAIEELMEEVRRKDREIEDCGERLKAAMKEIGNLERSCRLKDELISELKMENDELSSEEGMKDEQIKILKDEIKNLQIQGTRLESELTSSKVFLNQSQKEMTQYITHLESVINNTQESLDKTKQKLKESNQTISRLKNDNEVLEKEHQCDVKLFNRTKDELESVKEKLTKAEKRMEEAEEQREEMSKNLEALKKSEREKTEALEILSRKYKTLLEESETLKEKFALVSKDKDETLKEQKMLINQYGVMSKELQKLQDKYKSVKAECNERTDLIKYLEMLLKENLIEYNNRIACLEQNISRLVEKIAACKNGMKEKQSDSEVKELRHQLEVTCQERKELENIVSNYYVLMKHLESEIQEREKRVDELHVKLEQQRTSSSEKPLLDIPDGRKSMEDSKLEKLENEIAIAHNELEKCKKELHHCRTNHENEKKKLELTIADLKTEINRYKLRTEVIMKNFSNSSKNLTENRSLNEQGLKKELEEKNKKITDLEKLINKYLLEMSTKDADLENYKKKTACMEQELKGFQSQVTKLQDALSATSKTREIQQKEKDEMADKLLQSIKLIMEEKSARQTIETLAAEKEKNLKNQMEQIQNELLLKVKECETVSKMLEDKKNIISRLQEDIKRMKQELNGCKRRSEHKGSGDGYHNEFRSPSVSSERLEACMRDLKEIRDVNLQLRKSEGQYQAKIVRLEDEIRDARLLIKELQGDIKTEKKSKKALKNMIVAAKMEVEKCLLAKQLLSVVADRISRHLDLAEVPSRELLSGFRLSDS